MGWIFTNCCSDTTCTDTSSFITENACGVKAILSHSITYDGPSLSCTSIEPCDDLNTILSKINKEICQNKQYVFTYRHDNVDDKAYSIDGYFELQKPLTNAVLNTITLNKTLGTGEDLTAFYELITANEVLTTIKISDGSTNTFGYFKVIDVITSNVEILEIDLQPLGTLQTGELINEHDYTITFYFGETNEITVHNSLLDRNSSDAHPISSITGLQSALDSKSDIGHTHTYTEISNFETGVKTFETNTTLELIGNSLVYTREDGTPVSLNIATLFSDTFVQTATFNNSTNLLTITRNNGQSDIVVDLTSLSVVGSDTFVQSGSYLNGIITLTLNDASTVDVNISSIFTEALDNQVQSDFLQTDPSSKAYIYNKNPQKTISLGIGGNYNLLDTDNNYVIEIDNGSNDVTIAASTITLYNNVSIKLIQLGTGKVTINNADIVQQDYINEIYGRGHLVEISVINGKKYLHGGLAQDEIVVVTNTPPIANAGEDTTITEPTSSVILDGSLSLDTDGTIVSYLWEVISAPNTPTIVNPTSVTTSISGLIVGNYTIKLTVTDNEGATGTDFINITVNESIGFLITGALEVADCSTIQGFNNLINLPDGAYVGAEVFEETSTTIRFLGGNKWYRFTAGGSEGFESLSTLTITPMIYQIDNNGVILNKQSC